MDIGVFAKIVEVAWAAGDFLGEMFPKKQSWRRAFRGLILVVALMGLMAEFDLPRMSPTPEQLQVARVHNVYATMSLGDHIAARTN